MGKIDQTGKGKFTITYGGLESPMSGIDATHQSGLYLNPSSLAEGGGLISQDGYINTAFLTPRISIDLSLWGTEPAYVVGDVQVITTVQASKYVARSSWGFVVVSGTVAGVATLSVIYYESGFAGGATTTLSIAANVATNLTWYTVNGVVYITGLGLAAIYAFTPNGNGASTLTQLTNYVGGQYLGELNGRLICLACDQIVGGVYSYYPYMVSWSAGGGTYGQWNPLVGGLVTGAGFNNLPDVADEIVGFFMVGPTGYIIRKQGITEMTPLNSGIQPFDFNHMWASQKGIGSVFPNSVTQYGSLGAFLSDIGVFTIGYSGINQIEGVYWAEINRLLDELLATPGSYPGNYTQLLASVTAGLIPLYINNERKLVYALYIPTQDGLLSLGDVNSKDWNSISCFTNTQAVLANVLPISQVALTSVGSDQSAACVTALFGGAFNKLVLFSIDDKLIIPVPVNPPPFLDPSPSALFPIEEVMMNRDITIDSIGITADADVTAPAVVKLSLSIGNPSGQDCVYTPLSFSQQAQYLVAYPLIDPTTGADDIFTGKYPQLSIDMLMDSANSSTIRVYKIVLYCSYEPDQAP